MNLTLADIATTLNINKSNAIRRAAREMWPYLTEAVRGGQRRLYPLDSLPADVQKAVQQQRAAAVLESSSTSVSLPNRPVCTKSQTTTTDDQRRTEAGRHAVLAAIRRLQTQAGCSQATAMSTLLTLAAAGQVDTEVGRALMLARDGRGRKGAGNLISIRTLKRWLSANSLVPKVPQPDMRAPAWAEPLMRLYAQPQKPSLLYCLEVLPQHLPSGVDAPSYSAARRLLDKLGNIEKNRGRMLPRELKSLKPFIRRDASSMTPDAIYTADGHKLDAEVAHPRHGRPFRPEITTVLSVPTRRCVGWSAGLSENTWAVMDALRHAVETCGLPAIWYVDNGCGFKNASMTAEVTGFVSRLGISIEHSLPYNSQARGIEERSHQSIWVRGAKTLATFMGESMDREAKQRVYKLTRADMKTAGRSRYLMEFEQFLTWAQQQIDAYNNRPHRGLPKMRDSSGKLRHQTPNEAWQQAQDDGWQPMLLQPHETIDLFRPEQVCTTTRGEVRLLGNLYFAHELAELTGEKVRVGYDIHNAERVWVRDMDGRFICEAGFEANKRRYFSESVEQRALRVRAEGRAKRLENQLQEVHEELRAPLLLENSPTGTPLPMPMRQGIAVEIGETATAHHEIVTTHNNVVVMSHVEKRPMFTNDPEQYRWLYKHPAQWDSDDAQWLLDYTACDDYADLLERYEVQGVAWTEDDAEHARAKLDEGFKVASE